MSPAWRERVQRFFLKKEIPQNYQILVLLSKPSKKTYRYGISFFGRNFEKGRRGYVPAEGGRFSLCLGDFTLPLQVIFIPNKDHRFTTIHQIYTTLFFQLF